MQVHFNKTCHRSLCCLQSLPRINPQFRQTHGLFICFLEPGFIRRNTDPLRSQLLLLASFCFKCFKSYLSENNVYLRHLLSPMSHYRIKNVSQFVSFLVPVKPNCFFSQSQYHHFNQRMSYFFASCTHRLFSFLRPALTHRHTSLNAVPIRLDATAFRRIVKRLVQFSHMLPNNHRVSHNTTLARPFIVLSR